MRLSLYVGERFKVDITPLIIFSQCPFSWLDLDLEIETMHYTAVFFSFLNYLSYHMSSATGLMACHAVHGSTVQHYPLLFNLYYSTGGKHSIAQTPPRNR
jgi:hypothetical protein